MNKEQQNKLLESFPKLYRQYYLTVQESCMPWGFECPTHWFGPIYVLSKKLTEYMEATGITIEAAQVKEKFGGLRFYYDVIGENIENRHYDYITEAIRQAEYEVDSLGIK
jgi:hypothetical protein